MGISRLRGWRAGRSGICITEDQPCLGLPPTAPLITPALFSHRPPPNREKRENSQKQFLLCWRFPLSRPGGGRWERAAGGVRGLSVGLSFQGDSGSPFTRGIFPAMRTRLLSLALSLCLLTLVPSIRAQVPASPTATPPKPVATPEPT